MKKLSEHFIGIKAIILLLAFTSISQSIYGQIKGRVIGMSSPNTYKITIIPDQTWSPPNSITNTATITLKVPTGTFQIERLQSYVGNWNLHDPIIAPIEDPKSDYLVFDLASPLTTMTYEAGVAIDLFSFENKGICTTDIQILDDITDPFLPPNSRNANIGNYFIILGNGNTNAYAGTLTNSQLQDCNDIQYQLQLSDVKCAEDSLKARFVYQSGTPPMRVVLKKDNSFDAHIKTLTEVGENWMIPGSLEPGDYTLFMTDAAPDTIRYTFTVEEIEPLEIILLYKEDISCNDTDGALVHLLPKGIQSDESYTFKWSSGHTKDVVEGLRPGPYHVTLTNGKGCTAKTAFDVDGIPPIEIDITEVRHPSCPDVEDGYINVDVQGGIGIQYFYEWSDPNLAKRWSLDNLTGGDYELTVYDVSGCVGSANIQLDIPPPIEPLIQTIDPTCPEFADGSITIKANEDGATPFVYSLNNGTTKGQTDYNELLDGDYDVLITDSRNCSKLERVILEEPEEFKVELGEDRTFLIGEKKPIVTNDILDDPSYQFDWYPSESLNCDDCPNPIANPKETTTYSVIVTNDKGCSREDEVTININLDRPVYFPTAFSPNGDGNNDYFEIAPGKTTSEITRLRMFNRWGQLLYDSDLAGGAVKWDGNFEDKPVNKGVYIFSADILFADGVVLPYHGDVLLLR